MKKSWEIKNLNEIKIVVKEFIQAMGENRLFALNGAMGVGKTTFVKAFAEEYGIEDDVNSPTFSIVNEYMSRDGAKIYHFDFYRINHISEALDFGCEEYFYSGNICFMEWSEKISQLLPENVVNIDLKEVYDGVRIMEVDFG